MRTLCKLAADALLAENGQYTVRRRLAPLRMCPDATVRHAHQCTANRKHRMVRTWLCHDSSRTSLLPDCLRHPFLTRGTSLQDTQATASTLASGELSSQRCSLGRPRALANHPHRQSATVSFDITCTGRTSSRSSFTLRPSHITSSSSERLVALPLEHAPAAYTHYLISYVLLLLFCFINPSNFFASATT